MLPEQRSTLTQQEIAANNTKQNTNTPWKLEWTNAKYKQNKQIIIF